MKIQVYSKFRRKIWKKNEISKLHVECKIAPSQV
jgi:hypothetical protein